jgi:hypothetical protein
MPRIRKRLAPPVPPTLATIGWRERVRLPGLGIGPLLAKIDTGAFSAALHAEHIVVSGGRVRFLVPTPSGRHSCELPVVGHKRVKSSSGHRQTRVVVETDVSIGSWRFPTHITLTNRTDMGVPMLLGRVFLRGRFLVDPAHAYLLSQRQRKKRRS